MSTVAFGYVSKPDVVYDRINGHDVALDIYRPEHPTSSMPAMVYIHGGCFSAGSRKDIPQDVRIMADQGFMVFSVGYRLSNVAKYPAALKDVQQAIRYLRKNHLALNVDPDRIVVHGESAGGYLAAALGLRAITDRKGVVDEYSERVKLVSDWYGRTDFTAAQTTGVDCAEGFLGLKRSAETMANFKEASLPKDVNEKSADFFIVHGSNDQQVYPAHSSQLANALWRHDKKAELFFYENEGHGFNRTSPWKLTKNYIFSYFGMAKTEDQKSENFFRINFNVKATQSLNGKFELKLAFGAGPSVPLMADLKDSDFDGNLNYEGHFGVITKTRRYGLLSQKFSDPRDTQKIKIISTSKKLN